MHPSTILPVPDEKARHQMMETFVNDLRIVAQIICRLTKKLKHERSLPDENYSNENYFAINAVAKTILTSSVVVGLRSFSFQKATGGMVSAHAMDSSSRRRRS